MTQWEDREAHTVEQTFRHLIILKLKLYGLKLPKHPLYNNKFDNKYKITILVIFVIQAINSEIV